MRASLVAMAGRERTKRVRRAPALVSFRAFFEGWSCSSSEATVSATPPSSEVRCRFAMMFCSCLYIFETRDFFTMNFIGNRARPKEES